VVGAEGMSALPVLPVRNTVVLPNMVVSLYVDHDAALQAVEAAMTGDRMLYIVAQRSEETENPTHHDVYCVGTECLVTRMLRMPDGASSIQVQGMRRLRADKWLQYTPFGRVSGTSFDDRDECGAELEALMRTARGYFATCAKLNPHLAEDSYVHALNIARPGALADYIVAQIEPPIAVRQSVLETFDASARLRKVCQVLRSELTVLQLEQRIQDEVQREVDQSQREFYLRGQLKAIQRELGEQDPAQQEIEEIGERIKNCSMPNEIQARALKELARLHSLPPMSPEQSVLTNYLDWLVAVPWREQTTDQLDLSVVTSVLETRHFGLERVKDRILEFIAVRKLAPEGHSPILCLAGPPGVGKTTLGRSIAEALGRKFARISLGGVRDEAEIRGHRRTYVGALPGRIIQAMKSVGSTNPVLLLDEIDKLAADYRGDPAAALLEVLDPEQNATFSDHYLEVPYDLSQVFFIATANVLHTIPAPLRDRMEIIEISGYTEEEKVHIARDFLLPRQVRETGVGPSRIEVNDDALRRIIREYTFEAGVRNLDRELGTILRRVARHVAEGRRHKALVTAQRVPSYLGPQKYYPTEAEDRDEVGVATGLAWTAAGGDLTTVETMMVPGHGILTLTGQLGDVMRESAQAALTFLRSRAASLGLTDAFHEQHDIHVHLPAGAIPKDGPSAGITMAVAMVSACANRPVRRDVAMTGEITLRGRVLPVGGIKEKVLAAYTAGVTTVVLPQRNVKDLDDIASEVRERLTFVPVGHMDDVLRVALAPIPIEAAHMAPISSSGSGARRIAQPTATLPEALPAAISRVARSRTRRAVAVAP
jgi:ATP-dependent Lon protease